LPFQRLPRKNEFVEPDQRDLGRPVLFAKIFQFPSDPNHLHISHIPARTEGRFAIVTNVEQGMRMRLRRTALNADGEVVWS
jgi:hypothetical protein